MVDVMCACAVCLWSADERSGLFFGQTQDHARQADRQCEQCGADQRGEEEHAHGISRDRGEAAATVPL